MGALFPFTRPDLLPFPPDPVSGEHGSVAPEQMLRELEHLARRMGIEVRVEPFETHARLRGGLCRLRGVPVVLVDASASTVDKVGVLCEALATFDVEVLYVSPLLRARIQRSA